jgi:hypothetical protein
MSIIIHNRWPCAHAFSIAGPQTYIKFCFISVANWFTQSWSLTEVPFTVLRRLNYTTLAVHCVVSATILFSTHLLRSTHVESLLFSLKLPLFTCLCHYIHFLHTLLCTRMSVGVIVWPSTSVLEMSITLYHQIGSVWIQRHILLKPCVLLLYNFALQSWWYTGQL